LSDQIKKGEVGRAFVMYGGEEKCTQVCGVEVSGKDAAWRTWV